MSRPDGAWVAYHHDRSGFVIFGAEVQALRHALKNGMAVKFARFGDPDWQTRPDVEPELEKPSVHSVCRETR